MAICAAISARLRRAFAPPAALRPAWRALCTSRRVAARAGARPNRQAAAAEIASVKANARQPKWTGSRQLSCEASATSERVPHIASGIAAAAPRTAERQTLGEQLPHQPRASGAEREPYADFSAARSGARQQQARQVAARDQEREYRDALQ